MANTIKCDIEWKLSLNNIMPYLEEYQSLSSYQFANPQFPSVIWALRVYPNTKANHADSQYETTGGFVSLIRKEPVHSTIKAKYSIYATDVKQMLRIDIATSNEFTFTTQQNESPKYSIDVLTAYEFKDPLIFYCEVEFKPSNVENEEIIIDLSETSFTSHKSFNNMFKQGILTDCVIKVGDEQINAHRCVLANNSEVFHRMFEQENMIEAKNGIINIVDFTPECVRAMIDYFYKGEINKEILEKLLFELFAIAHKYEVKSLMDKCEYIIATRIDTKNFATCVDYTQLYNLPLLENVCIKFIATNRQTFLDSNEWKNCQELYTKKAFYLLELAFKNFWCF